MCSAAADPAAVKSYGRGKAGAGRRSAGAGAARIDVHTDALHVTVRAVPLPLRQQNLQILIPELIGYGAAKRIRRRQYRPMDGA